MTAGADVGAGLLNTACWRGLDTSPLDNPFWRFVPLVEQVRSLMWRAAVRVGDLAALADRAGYSRKQLVAVLLGHEEPTLFSFAAVVEAANFEIVDVRLRPRFTLGRAP